MYAVRGPSHLTASGRSAGIKHADIIQISMKSIFSTHNNVNFDPSRLEILIRETVEKRGIFKSKISDAGGNIVFDEPAATFQPAQDISGLVRQGEETGLPINWESVLDVKNIQETTLYGIHGAAAYADMQLSLARKKIK